SFPHRVTFALLRPKCCWKRWRDNTGEHTPTIHSAQDRLALLQLLRSEPPCSVDVFRRDVLGVLVSHAPDRLYAAARLSEAEQCRGCATMRAADRRTVQSNIPGLYCTAVTRPQVERSPSLRGKPQPVSIACARRSRTVVASRRHPLQPSAVS